ncbi:hypothetical protein C8R43DRAFT_910254 [Mycena crocata]|nr:hypothetical protein C8R43DRAFT_910254 [Mycena crocata]
MADHKPLPAIPAEPNAATAGVPNVTTPFTPNTPNPTPSAPTTPAVQNLTTLSIEARAHRGRFIRHILSDAELEDGEGWACALEDALDGMSDAVARGKWLAGVKRGRRRRQIDAPRNSLPTLSRTHTDTSGDAESVTFPAPPDALTQLRELAGQSILPSRSPVPKHLLLCVAPLGSRIAAPLPSEDSGFSIVPANVGCVFTPSVFAFPESDADSTSILYGLAEWNVNNATDGVALVGGTFTFKDSAITSPLLHHTLRKALRLAIYMHLSLLLEQHFLSDSGVRLNFPPPPKPRILHASTSLSSSGPPTPISPSENTGALSPRRHKTFLPGILSFFGKKNNTSLQRTATPATRSGASLDITPSHSRESSASAPDEGPSRVRRFSFIADPRPFLSSTLTTSGLNPSPATANANNTAGSGTSFPALLARLRASPHLLTTSPSIRLAPPPLIAALAAQEHTAHGRRLTGDEKCALGSIVGWREAGEQAKAQDKDKEQDRAGAMVGAAGFARMQEISVLVSSYVPLPVASGGASVTGTVASAASSIASIETRGSGTAEAQCELAQCERPTWTTWRYYARGGEDGTDQRQKDKKDASVGEVLRGLGARASDPCARPGCTWVRGEHVLRVVHGGVRVEVRIEEAAGGDDKEEKEESEEDEKEEDKDEEGRIDMWASCAECGAQTPRVEMSDGAYLFSFAKFLELLVYSPSLCTLTPALCTHTSPSTSASRPAPSTSEDSTTPTPSAISNIVRHFAARRKPKHVVSVALADISADVYEIRVPRLQIGRKANGERTPRTSIAAGDNASIASRDTKASTREIRAWWAGVADHMDRLETSIVGSTLVGFRKALPRLPSVDDDWDDDSDSMSSKTPKSESQALPKEDLHSPPRHLIAGLPPSAPTTPQIARSAQEFFPPPLPRASSDPPTPSESSTVTPPVDSIELLASLRQTFHGTEQALYAQLSHTPASTLNDVRRAFMAAARGAQKRLQAWQMKHLGTWQSKHLLLPGRKQKKQMQKMEMEVKEPEWWGRGCHTAPGGNIIIREDDWGSIIAFTMSTTDYYRELASMSLVRPSSMASANSPALTPGLTSAGAASSFFSSPSNLNYKLFASTTQAQPDPDNEDVVWHEPEAYSAVISRKEHPRDVTSLLSLREVLRQKSPIDAMSLSIGGSVLPGVGSSSRFSSLGSAATKASSVAPPSAWAKPDVQISKHAAGGEVSGVMASSESAGKILHELDASSASLEGSRPGSALSGSSFLASALFADAHIKRGKASSVISVESDDATIGGKSKEDEGSVVHGAPLTEEPESAVRHGKAATFASEAASGAPTPTPSSFTNTLTSGLTSAMRFMLSTGEMPRPSMFSKNHHGLLAPADAFAIDERPHIKYDWTIGKRLKFSCTVYYAKQFDNLRKRCGIDDVFLKSLSRSANWAAEGGKSKSNFWKTADDRFIIKSLVNAWNVADLQVLIELAPSYFRYMDATANKATVLAKLIGFYTIEIRNLETGNVQSKADLLVMENLFYDQKIHKTFDLKGIQGRKIKSNASAPTQSMKTLFDGEWIEGQQRTLTLVRPHSKVVLREALRSDAEFLAKSNIMDYSLLVGVDQERKQIACGLVDTIGRYTFAKTLEYKAKQGLNSGSGKDVTVIPPAEYQERFVSALDGYFVACPDKWSRAMDDTKPISDPSQLPSVL